MDSSENQTRIALLRRQMKEISEELEKMGEHKEREGEGEECLLCNGGSNKRKLHRTETPNLSITISGASNSTRRIDALSWDDYFMSVAFLSAMRSKDPSTQVGACIVSPDRRIVGIGYNGFPRGCSDDELPWARHGDSELETKYPYVCHAEMNAILNKNSADVKGCTIYVGLFPCNECAKMVIQSGISEVVYLSDKYRDTNSMIASRKMMDMAKISLRQHVPKCAAVSLDFGSIGVVSPSV